MYIRTMISSVVRSFQYLVDRNTVYDSTASIVHMLALQLPL